MFNKPKITMNLRLLIISIVIFYSLVVSLQNNAIARSTNHSATKNSVQKKMHLKSHLLPLNVCEFRVKVRELMQNW